MKIRNLKDIVSWRLCVGCGACAYICLEKKITLVDVLTDGIRPFVDVSGCEECKDCLEVCPGYEITQPRFTGAPGFIPELKEGWGPVLEIWEGFATDPQIRHKGSSGGITTAIALYCLEQLHWHGVFHTGVDPQHPLKNTPVMSRNFNELLSRTGSRYSPASTCEGLALIESAPNDCVFIGKPCDVAAVKKVALLRPELHQKIGVTLGIFCAGTPSTLGIVDFLKTLNVTLDDVKEIRYRGEGWPGMTAVKLKGTQVATLKTSYKQSWGFLEKYRPFRCYLCPDSTGEFADISCGDAWYRANDNDDAGYSLVLVRTERGRDLLRAAISAGYLSLEKASSGVLFESQKNLFLKRASIWGRLLAMRAFTIPIPNLHGFRLFENWLYLKKSDKLRSIFGTVRRIVQRKYYLSQRDALDDLRNSRIHKASP